MRTVCKSKGCNHDITPTKHSGARSVYCIPCDRVSAKERMRKLRVSRLHDKVDALYYKPKHGYVYIINNRNFPGWIKVGCALDADDRLSSYQTSSPHRNYKLKWARKTNNKLDAERQAHECLGKLVERKNEWFKMTTREAVRNLNQLKCWN